MRRGGISLLVALAAWALPAAATASRCGDADCGPGGSCRETSLIARCDCDAGWISIATYVDHGAQGAVCVPLPGDPESADCLGLTCTPHGACPAQAGGVCLCDPGYAATSSGCVDDPDDDGEAPCAEVRCGEGATCMATSDGVTCRCLPGQFVVLGLDNQGDIGPVCQAPPDPAAACGPDACGPGGRCVISQAAFCRCREGYHVEERDTPGAGRRPYCVDIDGTIPTGGSTEGARPCVDSSGRVDDCPSAERGPQAGCQHARDPVWSLPNPRR